MAHRVAWRLFVGDIPEGAVVCHRCDTPPCANPDHLFIGTQADNVADMMRKGRHRAAHHSPDTLHSSKLNRVAVRQIRERYATGERQRALAEAFGVGQSAISAVVNHRSWVEEPCFIET